MLQLYNYSRSSASFRVRIALNLKKLTYQDIEIHLLNNGGEHVQPDYAAINPQQLIPTLKDDEKIITQSLAIIDYLEDVYPTPSLLPNDPYQRALVRSFALAIIADVHPLNNLRVLKYLTQDLGLSEDKKNTWYQHWIKQGLSALEKKLTAKEHTDDFCFGNTPTIADICLVPQLFNARRFNCDLSAYPTLTKIDAHCQTLPAFEKAWPQ